MLTKTASNAWRRPTKRHHVEWQDDGFPFARSLLVCSSTGRVRRVTSPFTIKQQQLLYYTPSEPSDAFSIIGSPLLRALLRVAVATCRRRPRSPSTSRECKWCLAAPITSTWVWCSGAVDTLLLLFAQSLGRVSWTTTINLSSHRKRERERELCVVVVSQALAAIQFVQKELCLCRVVCVAVTWWRDRCVWAHLSIWFKFQ